MHTAQVSVTQWDRFSAEPLTRSQRAELTSLHRWAVDRRRHLLAQQQPVRLIGSYGQVLKLAVPSTGR